MTTRLKASLEEAIDKWVKSECDSEDWLKTWWPDSLTPRMAEAAYQVMMANHDGQSFADEQGK